VPLFFFSVSGKCIALIIRQVLWNIRFWRNYCHALLTTGKLVDSVLLMWVLYIIVPNGQSQVGQRSYWSCVTTEGNLN
jgi:hypothetical protein